MAARSCGVKYFRSVFRLTIRKVGSGGGEDLRCGIRYMLGWGGQVELGRRTGKGGGRRQESTSSIIQSASISVWG